MRARTRQARRSRPPVRLISFSPTTSRTAPGAADGGKVAPTAGPGPLRHPPSRATPAPPGPRLYAVPAAEESPEDDLAVAVPVTVRVLAEVIAGVRPLHHLAGRVTPEVYDRLGRTLPLRVTGLAGGHASRTLRVIVPVVQAPLPGVVEASAVVFIGGHAQALALRLERLRGGWRCAAVETTISPGQLREHHAPRRARGRGTAA